MGEVGRKHPALGPRIATSTLYDLGGLVDHAGIAVIASRLQRARAEDTVPLDRFDWKKKKEELT